jgi:hypothetical protein
MQNSVNCPISLSASFWRAAGAPRKCNEPRQGFGKGLDICDKTPVSAEPVNAGENVHRRAGVKMHH